MSRHLTPLDVALALIGPPERLGAIIGLHVKTPYGWRHPAKDRAAGDFPSTNHMRALLAHSQKHGLGLTADHLIFGASEDEVAAIIASWATPAEAAE
jgi:hypothetical protein